MDKKYEVTYLPLFYKDLDEITDYIMYQLNNPIAANNLLDEINQVIESRAYNPKNYEKYDSARRRKVTYYRIYVKKYIIFYTVKNNTMEVRRILYGRRNFAKLL